MDIIRELLKRYPNKRSAMARDLGISRTSLWKRIKQIEDIDRIHELGYNGLRKHQKLEDERFLYWCDVKGMLDLPR